jgi:hypothetical protein
MECKVPLGFITIVPLSHTSRRFRWVFCQLEVLRHCFPANLRHILEELPKSLDETYKRILNEINNANRVHAYRLLQCLAVALRPLRVEELAEVLAFDLPTGGLPKLNASWRWEDQEEAVLSACSSLVSVIIDRWLPGRPILAFLRKRVPDLGSIRQVAWKRCPNFIFLSNLPTRFLPRLVSASFSAWTTTPRRQRQEDSSLSICCRILGRARQGRACGITDKGRNGLLL